VISRYKMTVLKEHLLNEREDRKKAYIFRGDPIFMEVLAELHENGLVEIECEGKVVTATRITPAGALCYLRKRGNALSKKGRDYFKSFVSFNPGFLERCGPIQKARIMKYLVLGHMPSFSKKSQGQGQ